MKSNSPIKKRYLSLTIAAILTPVGTIFSAPAFANDDLNSEKMETVVIVGEKMAKTLKDTTTAVTVITEDDFRNGEIRDLNEIVASTPNVSTSGFGAISIRGIESSGAATGGISFYSGGRARVTTNVDNEAQSWSGYNFTPSKLWDVNQIEVLRGPQSTTQGTNSIGGTIAVTTNDPTYYWEGAVRGGFESYENGNTKYNTAVMASGPLIDNELAFRLAVDAEKGDGWISYESDSSVDLNDYPDLDDSENINARLKLLWEPEAIPELSVKLTGNKKSYEGEYLNWATDDGYDSQTFTLSNSDRDYTRQQDSEVQSIATDISYQLTPGITNALHIGYGTADILFSQYSSSLDLSSLVDTFTIENKLIFKLPNTNLSSVLGLYYSKTNTIVDIDTSYNIDRDSEVSVAAIYNESIYTLTPDLKLVGGLRVENEKNNSDVFASFGVDSDVDTSENILLPKVGVIYDINQNTTLSSSLQKGYNAGGYAINFDSTADNYLEYYSYDEESVIAFEAGMLNTFGNAELSTNLFYNDYDDYVAASGFTLVNVDESRTYGVEIGGSLWVNDSLKLNSSLGYLKTEVTGGTYKDGELPNAPDINASIGLTHYLNPMLSYSANLAYVGEYYSDIANTDDLKAGDYVTANLNIQYEINDFMINAYVKNLANEDVIYYHNSAARAAVGQSRTFGLNTTYRW